MGSARDIRFSDYCDSMYGELTGMRARLLGFSREIEQMTGPEMELLKSHIQHFRDLAGYIEWKLEIMTRVCPFDWSGYAGDVENTVSVQVTEEAAEKETIAGGYLGG